MQSDARSLRRSEPELVNLRRRFARKTVGFLALLTGWSQVQETHQETRCGIHRQLAPCDPSFLMAV
jgi:hypothetical protein